MRMFGEDWIKTLFQQKLYFNLGQFKGHNSGAIQLVIICGSVIMLINIVCKFGDEWRKTVQIRDRTSLWTPLPNSEHIHVIQPIFRAYKNRTIETTRLLVLRSQIILSRRLSWQPSWYFISVILTQTVFNLQILVTPMR